MSESPSTAENRETTFNMNDLTPFEHVMIGSSTDVQFKEKAILCNFSSVGELMKDKDARKQILSPINLTERKKTLEEVDKARREGEVFSGILNFFDDDDLIKYLGEDIWSAFRPGELDEFGQLNTFGMFFLKDDKKITPPDKVLMELPVPEPFVNLVQHLGNENGEMKFMIKSAEEIKSGTAPKPQNM